MIHLAHTIAARFAVTANDRTAVLATVPPQHMYGLETSIMLPLQSGGIVYGGRPFFPEDVRAAMSACRSPQIFVTTPVHIRACVEAGLRFPVPRFVLSATAPLSRIVASQAEKAFAAAVLEIYGCTEAGTVATRRTVIGDTWELVDGLKVRVEGSSATVEGAHLAAPVVLSDYVELQPSGQLTLKGRKADLINVAGKRMSLGDLNQKLLEIAGVLDGAFVVPDESDGPVPRLVALVVAPQLTRQQIMAELRSRLDPVFLPRPLYLIDRLPRNTVGKLTKDELSGMVALCNKAAMKDSA